MLLNNINYPVFPIRSHNTLYVKDGIDYIDTGRNNWQIDNKNLQGKTLAERRLRIPSDVRYPLTTTIFNPMQLLRWKKGNIFIDSLGNIFTYKKTRFEKLEYYKIIGKTIVGDNVALHTGKHSMPFYVTRGLFDKVYTHEEPLYVGLLSYHGGHLVYDLSTKKHKTTRRKV